MGTDLNPRIKDPKRRHAADVRKGLSHRSNLDGESRERWERNAKRLFGESPNLRKR